MSIGDRARRVLGDDPIAAALLEQALGEPGVGEALSLYEDWLAADASIQPYANVMQPKLIVTNSNSSTTPVARQ
ncbi:MAG: hypothetical protein ACYC5Q_02160 [Thermoleophilia bacterium]